MIKEICKDLSILSTPSLDFECNDDRCLLSDLKDTLEANRYRCVGMAANMIGVNKNVIVIVDEYDQIKILINPKIIRKERPYHTQEGCLSLDGERDCTRFEKIRVTFLTEELKEKTKNFIGFTAEIVQHECDHLEGVII